MNEFDLKAAGWDQNPMHWDRSVAIVNELLKRVPVSKEMSALEYGAGTGITSFLLKDHLIEITMMDSSEEMVKIMNEKIRKSGAGNLQTLLFDLEKNNWNGNMFDLILTQMVLHHITDVEGIIKKLYLMLNPGGIIAIADLFSEDGSFHGTGFSGHNGFEPVSFKNLIKRSGFGIVSFQKCFVINKKITESESRDFDVFLLTAKKKLNKSTRNLTL
jgi:tRNA (cmo5U34)-methyltransferase